MAVAGARKTQSIVDACKNGPLKRRLVISYTLTGQQELTQRLNKECDAESLPEVLGWYSFLIGHWIKPYLPLFLPGRRLRGFSFEGNPGRFASGAGRYLDAESQAYKLHLSKLAIEVAKVSQGSVVDRLQRIYDEIYIDEVQDMTGCDLHVMDAIMESAIDLHMVGDIRQSVFDTNPQDPNLKQYRGLKMLDWFLERQASGALDITNSNVTWRSNQLIADFSDSLFDESLGFTSTVSRQSQVTGHDGVFIIKPEHVYRYYDQYQPLCLRWNKVSGKEFELPFKNFGMVKGITADRVLIHPTGTIEKLIKAGTPLANKTACSLYVGVTRAKHSVVFIMADGGNTTLPAWP